MVWASDGGRAAVRTAGRRGAISVKEAREILNLDTAAVSHRSCHTHITMTHSCATQQHTHSLTSVPRSLYTHTATDRGGRT